MIIKCIACKKTLGRIATVDNLSAKIEYTCPKCGVTTFSGVVPTNLIDKSLYSVEDENMMLRKCIRELRSFNSGVEMINTFCGFPIDYAIDAVFAYKPEQT